MLVKPIELELLVTEMPVPALIVFREYPPDSLPTSNWPLVGARVVPVPPLLIARAAPKVKLEKLGVPLAARSCTVLTTPLRTVKLVALKLATPLLVVEASLILPESPLLANVSIRGPEPLAEVIRLA